MWISDGFQDLRFAVRMLAKRPAFAAAAIAVPAWRAARVDPMTALRQD